MAGTGNTQGVSPQGTYLSTVPGIYPIAQSAIPSYTLAGSTTLTVLNAINLVPPPGQSFDPDCELIVHVKWSCTSSVNTKTVQCLFGDIGTNSAFLPWSDVQTTNVSNEWDFRISFRNNLASQVISASQNCQPTTNGFAQTTYPLNWPGIPGTPLQMSFWGTCANAADNIRIDSYSVWLAKAPTQSSTRLQYGKKMFWGGNAHFDDLTTGGGGITPAQALACLQAMNMTVLRLTWEGSDASLNSIAAMARVLQGTGIQIYCTIDLSLIDPSTGGIWATEAKAFAYGWGSAKHIVSTLLPLGVTMYECGNELDTKNGMNAGGATGYYEYLFTNSQWPAFRGIISGAMQAVQSLGGLAASNACTVCGVGAMNMLWNGRAPDGSTGYEQLRWDISAFHNYQPYGPLTSVQTFASGPYVNIYEYLWRAFNKPIIISEFNGAAGNTEAQNATWCTRTMQEAYSLRYKYNIAGMIIYQMFQGDPWGMIATPSTATPSNPLGTTVQALMGSTLPDSGN